MECLVCRRERVAVCIRTIPIEVTEESPCSKTLPICEECWQERALESETNSELPSSASPPTD